MTKTPSFNYRDCLAMHETALDIHRSNSLSQACQTLADALLANSLICGFRASLGIRGPSPRTDLLIATGTASVESEDDSHLAEYVINLPTGDCLRLEIVLPFGSRVREQVLVEILLEHLCAASRWLPLRELPPEAVVDFLTRRERKVLPHLLAGYPNSSIARLLRISPRTVEKHVTSILHKFDCDNRIALMAKEFRANG